MTDERMRYMILYKDVIPFRSFKTTPRSQNAHAYVTAAFAAKVASPSSDLTVEERAFLVYGGISGGFVRAANTERFLIGKKLDDPQGITRQQYRVG